MAEATARPVSSRVTRWGWLAAVLVLLLSVYAVIVPFKSAVMTIDRRTGAFFGDTSYFGVRVVHDWPVATPVRGNPVGKGPLTAEERRIPVRSIIQRFPWSQSVTTFDDVGIWYAEAFYQMFYRAGWSQPKERVLSDDDLEHLVKERIPFWNSSNLDHDPRSLAEAARQENSDLLGIPVEHVFKR